MSEHETPDRSATEYVADYGQVPTRRPATRYRVTRDGKPTGTTGTYNECWIALHKASSGCSVDWLMRYEGYAIEAVND